MIRTISNPTAPATTRQTFACFAKTGYDVRGCNLTMKQASDILDGKLDPGTLTGTIQKRKAATPKQDFEALYAAADAAGMKAGQACIPTPMTVVGHANPLNDNSPVTNRWVVSEGACGFAWVSFAGTTSWARWAKAKGVASRHYPTGYCVWVHQFNQSITRKESYAEAFAKILRDNGITAYAGSRLD